MTRRPITSPEGQSATFVELFFDLVFVFSITQLVGLLHDGLTWVVVGQAVLVFWLVWWAWTQFTWALNAADTTHPMVVLGTLAATAVAFFMAVTLPDAFHDLGLWFAITYVLVRVIGLALHARVSVSDVSRRAAVGTFTTVSIGGLVAVLIGGIAGGSTQYWLWGFAIVLDVIATIVGGQSEGWNLHPEHFVERHGLFVIIALGETLIVAASGATGAVWSGSLIAVAVLAVAISCALWWSYFPRQQPALEEAMAERGGAEQAQLARDAFSLLHFPMLLGIVAFAFAVEEAIAHPGDPLVLTGRLALAGGVALFVGGTAAARWRATGHLLAFRAVLTAALAVSIVALSGVAPLLTLAIALVGVVAIVAVEEAGVRG